MRGLVSGTIPFSSVDGPGNRCVVFLQGCNFDCLACHNPYTINVCSDCGECLTACASGALRQHGGRVRWHAERCDGADACVAACPYDSSPKARSLAVSEVVDLVRRPAPFLSGVTVSGGEATQQAAFVRALFEALRDEPVLSALTRFVDSNGAAPAETWDLLEPVMDGAMIDLKALDEEAHRRLTGRSVAAVLRTIERLAARGKLFEVRLLLLPGLNDSHDALSRTAGWLYDVDPALRVKLIGFRGRGVRVAGRAVREPTTEEVASYADVFRAAGLERVTTV